MKNNIIYSLFLFLAVLVTSCELPDNIDPKNPSTVSPDALFSQAEIALVTQLTSMNVNENISRLLAQYQSEVTYTTESRYNFSDRQIPDAFSENIYALALINLKDCKANIDAKAITPAYTEGIKKNQLATANLMEIYAYHVLVDQYGNIPYTEALKGDENSRPKYDDALTIYKDLITRIDGVIADLDTDYEAFGKADVLYGGDVSLWIKFAASLKLRFALRLSDVSGINSDQMVSEAIATGVFTNQSESAIFVPTGIAPYVSPYYQAYVLDARKDFTPSNTIVDKMNVLNDPRREKWFTRYEGEFVGIVYGKTGSSTYRYYSHFVDEILFDPAYPTILCDYVEVEFLLAEAAERNLGDVTGAAGHYNTAIRESMAYWGVSNADASIYLAQPSVAYLTATGDFRQKIGTQKWLGLFDRGIEGWAEWRRLDYPVLNYPAGLEYSDIPKRMPYPFNENKMNKTNYDAAAAAIGSDKATTKLFWDKF